MKQTVFILAALLLGAFPLHSQFVTIPDAAFLRALIEAGVDINGDSLISHDEAELITYLDIEGSWEDGQSGEIKNMKGIEAFINLDTLRCSYNLIASLNLSRNTSLTFLRCNENQLTSLDVHACKALTKLDCDNNQLSSLDVSNNASLTNLQCWENHLSSLDVSDCNALARLDCDYNQLSSLDVSNNTALKRINLRDNPTLHEVCVWTMPFPAEVVKISTEGSPNVYFTSDCSIGQ